MRPTHEQMRFKRTSFRIEYVQDQALNPGEPLAMAPAWAAGVAAYTANPVLDQPWPQQYVWGTENWWLWWLGVFEAAGFL